MRQDVQTVWPFWAETTQTYHVEGGSNGGRNDRTVTNRWSVCWQRLVDCSTKTSFHVASAYRTGNTSRRDCHAATPRVTGQQTPSMAVTCPEAFTEVRRTHCRLEGNCRGGVGLVGKDQLLKATDELVVWHGQRIQGQSKHAGNDVTQVYQLTQTTTSQVSGQCY